jgi:hypothetical protein
MLPETYEQVWLSAVRPTLVRKVNADDKRQAAELIGLDGGDSRREPLDTRKATFGVRLLWLDSEPFRPASRPLLGSR